MIFVIVRRNPRVRMSTRDIAQNLFSTFERFEPVEVHHRVERGANSALTQRKGQALAHVAVAQHAHPRSSENDPNLGVAGECVDEWGCFRRESAPGTSTRDGPRCHGGATHRRVVEPHQSPDRGPAKPCCQTWRRTCPRSPHCSRETLPT